MYLGTIIDSPLFYPLNASLRALPIYILHKKYLWGRGIILLSPPKYIIEPEKTDTVCTRKPCLSFLLLNFFIFYFPQKYFDAFYRFFNILQGVRVCYTNESFSAVAKGIPWHHSNALIIE